MGQSIDIAETFSRLAREDRKEETTLLGGVNARLVRVAGGGEGRWDVHADTAEIVVVWRGDFQVEFHDHTLQLTAGQSCVVPSGAEHRGTSKAGADVVLYQQAH